MSQRCPKLIEEYMQFSKYQRAQHLKSLKNYFEGIVESRLLEGTYTCEEVEGILKDVRDGVCGEVESESMSVSYMTTLLLKQLVQQADEAGLELRGDISEMQNGDLLEQIRGEEMRSDASFSQTPLRGTADKQHECEAAHENLKKILSKKNELIMQLREKLLKYESNE